MELRRKLEVGAIVGCAALAVCSSAFSADEPTKGIIYLASDESSFVTGSSLIIDGGMTAD